MLGLTVDTCTGVCTCGLWSIGQPLVRCLWRLRNTGKSRSFGRWLQENVGVLLACGYTLVRQFTQLSQNFHTFST